MRASASPRKVFVRHLFLSGIGLAVVGLARLTFNVSALHTFGEQILGHLNLQLSMGALLSLPPAFALSALASQRIGVCMGAGKPREAAAMARALLLIAAASAAVLALGCWAATPWLSQSLHLPAHGPLRIAALAAGFVFYQVSKSILYAVERVRTSLKLELIGGVLFVFVFAAASLQRAPAWTLAAFISMHTGYAALAVITMRGWLRETSPIAARSWRRNASFAAWSALSSSASIGAREIATIVAGLFWGDEVAGVFALLLSLLQPLSFFSRATQLLFFPAFSRIIGSGDSAALADTVARATRFVAVVNTFGVGGFVVVSDIVLRQSGIEDRVLLPRCLWILAAGTLILLITLPSISARMARGQARLPALSCLLGLFVAMGIWCVGHVLAGNILWLTIGYAASLITKALPPFSLERAAHRGLLSALRPIGLLVLLTLGALTLRHATGAVVAAGCFAVLGSLVCWPALKRAHPTSLV